MSSNSEKGTKNNFVAICIVQSVCIAVILLTALIIRLFFENTYFSLQGWCKEKLFERTKITADFDEET